jgi:hypothetical protein
MSFKFAMVFLPMNTQISLPPSTSAQHRCIYHIYNHNVTLYIIPQCNLRLPLFPPLCPFFCFRGLDWTNILKLKVEGFQNAIIHAYICSRTSRILEDVKHPPFCPFCALGDLIGQIGLKIEGPSFLKCYHTCLYLL